MRLVIMAAGCAALCACDAASSEDKNVTANSSEVTLRPGKYQVDFVREVMVPGQPSEAKRDMDSVCLSPEAVRHLEPIFLPGLGRCQDREVQIEDGEVSAKMKCDFPELGASGAGFEVRGTYDEESADLTGDATLPEGTLRETRTFRRQGDC